LETNRDAANHTVPYETDPLLDSLLAINCQATIILSLRDKGAFRPRTLMVHLQRAHIRTWFLSSLLWLVLRFGQRYAISLAEQDAIIQPSRSPYGNILGSQKEPG
jgi:hypothetical protein